MLYLLSQIFYGTGPSIAHRDQLSESSPADDSESDEVVCSGDKNQSSESNKSDNFDHKLVADCEEQHHATALPIPMEKLEKLQQLVVILFLLQRKNFT